MEKQNATLLKKSRMLISVKNIFAALFDCIVFIFMSEFKIVCFLADKTGYIFRKELPKSNSLLLLNG